MIKYEKLYEDVKEVLSEERFNHSERVVKRAIEYAKIYNVDIEMVKLVAISHDIAKELSEEENQKYISKYNIKLDDIEKVNKSLLHAKIGAYICKEKYGFTDDMINSVRYHTTGRENMSILEKIIYLFHSSGASSLFSSPSPSPSFFSSGLGGSFSGKGSFCSSKSAGSLSILAN